MNTRKIKTPLPLRIISWMYPKVEILAPWLAKRWFVRIFFSTAKYKVPYGEVEAADSAKKYMIESEGKKIQVYEWGEGKPVLMVHGWMGRATQFRKFIPQFNEAGYKVVAFDATGHGRSEGNSSHIMKFANIIKLLHDQYNGFEMIVGHSLGGVASMHAIIRGAYTNKLTMISSPAIGDEIMMEFRKKIGASELPMPYFEKYLKKKFGNSFEEYSASYNVEKMENVQLLLIYDEDDREVSMRNPEILMQKKPSARLITTSGLGHTRILKDDFVIEQVVKNTKKASQTMSAKELILS
jgi:pimeloyl-ACP methyl ester carboxylesterase